MSQPVIEKVNERRFMLKPSAEMLAQQAVRERLAATDPAALRSGQAGQTLADLRGILADLLELVRRGAGQSA